MGNSTRSAKWFVAAVTTVACAAAAYLLYPLLRAEVRTVRVEDRTNELRRAADARHAERGQSESAGEDSTYPPPLVREPLDEATAELFFPGIGTNQSCSYDPHEYTRRAPHYDQWFKFAEHPDGGWRLRTNGLGMRNDAEVAEVAPDRRILLTGDSHIEGVCANVESCAFVLETLLRGSEPQRSVEVLNAGAGAHNLFNYLGTFERFAELDPDLYVVVVYGGNDFSGAMLLDRYFRRRPAFKVRPYLIEQQQLPDALASLLPQEVSQDIYFGNNPDDVQAAIDLSCAFSVELKELCAANGSDLLFVYLPPPTIGQPDFFRADLDRLMQHARMDPAALGVSDRIADAWLSFLTERGIAFLDLRDAFRAAEEVLYWRTDHHLNLAGHRLLGELLHESLEASSLR